MTPPVPVPIPGKRPSPGRPGGPNRQEWFFRLAIVVLLLVPVVVATWCLQRLTPLQQKSKDLSLKVGRVSLEVESLERTWTQQRIQEITGKLHLAEGQLFRDQAALETWLSTLKEHGDALGLEVKANFGRMIAQKSPPGDDLAVVPATVSVEVRPAATTDFDHPETIGKLSPYQRLFQFSHRLTAVGKRADLAEINVDAGTNSVASATLVFHLWAGKTGLP
jgi:hypothetical protein